MQVQTLNLENYRNIKKATIEFEPQGAILTGKNGTGKTNLLESIAYFSIGKSILGLKDSQLIHFTESYFRIWANFKMSGKIHYFEAASDQSKKIIKINKNNILKISDLFRFLKILYFSPQDVQIVNGTPGLRRTHFDFSIAQIELSFLKNIRNYQRIIQQRNALLKNSYNSEEKIVWDNEFSKSADSIFQERKSYLERLEPILQRKFKQITDEKENIHLRYISSFDIKEDSYKKSIEEAIKKSEKAEIRNERTMIGPHLDDFGIFINHKTIKHYGSQGQKRSFVIALRLAQAELISKQNFGSPILMFDDVLADLDAYRTKNILKMLKDKHQIFIATPHPETYKSIDLKQINVEKINEN